MKTLINIPKERSKCGYLQIILIFCSIAFNLFAIGQKNDFRIDYSDSIYIDQLSERLLSTIQFDSSSNLIIKIVKGSPTRATIYNFESNQILVEGYKLKDDPINHGFELLFIDTICLTNSNRVDINTNYSGQHSIVNFNKKSHSFDKSYYFVLDGEIVYNLKLFNFPFEDKEISEFSEIEEIRNILINLEKIDVYNDNY